MKVPTMTIYHKIYWTAPSTRMDMAEYAKQLVGINTLWLEGGPFTVEGKAQCFTKDCYVDLLVNFLEERGLEPSLDNDWGIEIK